MIGSLKYKLSFMISSKTCQGLSFMVLKYFKLNKLIANV